MAISHEEDFGGKPYVIDLEDVTEKNDKFRRTLWTGSHLQLTVMSIPVGGDIGLEAHDDVDQFIRIEGGKGKCVMGESAESLTFEQEVADDDAILVPAGLWHNIVNTGDEPLQLYTVYGPADHKPGTVHDTQEDAENDPDEQH
ncbi:cupin domain-containing protein [Buchananella hordeovulneris]|uniref:cupin domain-containing protein n=1 Tax=Buchananella hordeovulneris TaxID=52770 RepID=UPI000F5D5C80|nr:cupin domain-containing protein [Buchananella hordeovulneris]RRD44369.1 cupin domain-containing protein [Buchananella hordeovulneris]